MSTVSDVLDRLRGEDDVQEGEDLAELQLDDLADLGEAAAIVYWGPGETEPRVHEFSARARPRLYGTAGAVVVLSDSIGVTDDRQIEG